MKRRGNVKEVAEICECTIRHVNKTWKKYCDGEIDAILVIKMGRPVGSNKKLTLEYEIAIQKEITNKNPTEAGLSGYLWGRAEVSELVKRRYGIEMPLSTMSYYLTRWNFTNQRPKERIIVKTKKT